MRDNLPQLSGPLFLTDSGLETDLIFHHGAELPCFAAFPLLDSADGRELLTSYFRGHIALAAEYGTGFVFEAPTWRASPDWAAQLGYDSAALAGANRSAVSLGLALRDEIGGLPEPIVVSGCVGPRADGYVISETMTADQARAYHRPQLEVFADAGADMACAMTLGYPDEAVGIVQAAQQTELTVAISFTVETDGNLPDGTALADAVRAVDERTDAAAAYFMINCAHPDHIEPALIDGGDWLRRVRGVRANASRRSHAELDASPDLDDGNPAELGNHYRRLRERMPWLTVLGGCCGTDVRHVRAIAAACTSG